MNESKADQPEARSVELSFQEMAGLTDYFRKCLRPFKARDI
jgi:hypothetical protein